MVTSYKFIEPTLPSIENIGAYLKPAYETGHFTNFGPACLELEKRITEKFASKNYSATTVTNATAGLQVVLNHFNVRNKAVVVPDFTFPATFHAVVAAGGIPIICDVDLETSELNINSLKDLFDSNSQVAAVIHVRCFGARRNTDDIVALCHKKNVPIIFDSAAALGDSRQKRFGSRMGEIEVFSLHTTKVFAAGEGGVILAPDTLKDDLRERTNFGIRDDRSFGDGINAKMDEYRCAVGLATLDLLSEIIEQRSEHVKRLKSCLSVSSNIVYFPTQGPQTWCNFPIYSNCHTGDELKKVFEKHGVETRRYYFPSMSQGYKGDHTYIVHSSKNALYLTERTLCIPVYSHQVENAFFEAIGAAVKEIG